MWKQTVRFLVLAMLAGCAKRQEIPQSAYDPAVLAAVEEAAQAEQERREALAASQAEQQRRQKGECDYKKGGCPEGFVCWDSYFCKNNFSDQCKAAGDRRCHKRCREDGDCPKEMPSCQEIPLFLGTESGVLEKFCVAE
jgi:hypothetical protein